MSFSIHVGEGRTASCNMIATIRETTEWAGRARGFMVSVCRFGIPQGTGAVLKDGTFDLVCGRRKEGVAEGKICGLSNILPVGVVA